MGRKGTRRRLATGIYEDGTGRCIVYRGREHRFPPFTEMHVLRDAREKLVRKLKGSGRLTSARGTLAAAVDAWESQEQHLASWKERRAELRAWVELYGTRRLTSLTAADVRRAFSQWTADGIAPKTLRNRRWTLKRLFQVTCGPETPTPVDHVAPPAVPRRVITPVTPETILTVYANLLAHEREGLLRDAKTRARFMVRAATGRRPSEIMRAEPEDVDLERRIWRVRDGKGGWSEGLYLNDDMIAAWKVFLAADAWGAFNTGSMAEVLRTCGWPEGIRPYNLRHSIGIGLSEAGHDLADVGGWLGHTDLRTTRAAYVPVLKGRMQRLSESLEGRLTWARATPSATISRSDMRQPAQKKGPASVTPIRRKQAKTG